MRRFARRPSPAMAVAFIALLAALSGTAVALPGKNTVDSGDIKKGAVKTPDVAKNAVTAPKIRNGAVTRPKIRNGAVNGAKVGDDSLTGTDINESTLGQVPSANTANSATTAGNAGALGGVAPSGYQRAAQWALVQPDGTIAAQSGGITVTKAGFPGNYAVDFNTPTAGRLVIASSALANDISFRGVVSAAPCTGGPPEAYVGQTCAGGNAPDKVEVFTDNAGESATEDHAFYVALF
jgi:hypothetical protein